MKDSGMIIEFVVVGAIAVAVLLLPVGFVAESLPALPELTAPAVAALGLIILFLLYFVGTLTHFVTWWWWRRVFHRRWFSSWLESDSGKLYFPLAKEAFREQSSALARDLVRSASSRRGPGFILDWCRFFVFCSGASELQVQYLRQFHLYRLAYGPLTAAVVALLVAVAFSIAAFARSGLSLPMLLVPALVVLVVASVAGANHRVGRMWKYLCYSAWVVSRSSAGRSTVQNIDVKG